MLFDATCPSCGASQQMNSMYAGTSRTCRACGAAFVLQLPSDVRAAVEARRPKKPSAQALVVTCESCLATFKAPVGPGVGDPHRTSGAIQCASCGGSCAPAATVRARVDATEKALLSALLTGIEPAAAVEQLAAPSWSPPVAARMLARCQRDLPFLRAYLWNAVLEGRSEIRMAPPVGCDLCAKRLSAAPRPLDATWRRVTVGDTKISPVSALTLFGGALVLRRERTVETLQALYFLCRECRDRLEKLFRRYDGYPANIGYELDALRAL